MIFFHSPHIPQARINYFTNVAIFQRGADKWTFRDLFDRGIPTQIIPMFFFVANNPIDLSNMNFWAAAHD